MTIDPATSIPAFFAGQSIFLTGATGFLGKTFIEKILRSCPDVREIFLLIRPKKGLSVNQRLETMLKLPVFDKLHEKRPSSFEKIIPISGNTTEKVLGLADVDKQMLIERVTIIIHLAASVKFNNSLKYAIFSNTRATRDICILAQNMKSIIALVYVSTAFTNIQEPFIEEKVYPPIFNWKKVIKMAESLEDDEHILNVFTAKFLDSAPNTYIFSKNLAENIIQEYSSSLPCAIVRPSAVFPSMTEPMPGWIDNIYGPIGLYIGAGKGIIHIGYIDKHVSGKMVPVDIVIKAILVVCWKIGLTTSTADSTLFVLNCAHQNSLTLEDDIRIFWNILKNEVPYEGKIWRAHEWMTDNYTLFYIVSMLFHIFPAVLIDLALKCFGRRPMLLQLQRRLYVANLALFHFCSNDWKFGNTNKSLLISTIPPEDQDAFSFDYSNCDIREYYKNCVIGSKKYILHEKMDINQLHELILHNKRCRILLITQQTPSNN
ncbi:fatty acyl-CoA reductase 1-like isoform X2 [Solenopsis invicta]|uniref:fatty acyl-CoA reductase 1-like isoform X2 n=1 Tax=Solenopsis invicta TaxID=13686 RepID=UPI00193E689C|nr:fatty acyl-CoA reductase 1-like isoform X2 [Solenopsis invicta]